MDKYIARFQAILHKILHPSHNLIWKGNAEPEIGCDGDIYCDTCDILFWCRFYDNPKENSKRALEHINKRHK